MARNVAEFQRKLYKRPGCTTGRIENLLYCPDYQVQRQPGHFSKGQACQGDHHQPAIITDVFPNIPRALFWLGSPHASDSNRACHVDFGFGYKCHLVRSIVNRVRLAHRGQ